MLSDAAILDLLRERVDHDHRAVGLVVGVVSPEGRRIIAHGVQDRAEARPVSGETLFEIGSATKLFTALLLADAVCRGELALGDPVAKYLPQEARPPTRNGRSITLFDLATHTAGLPMFPPGAPPFGDPAWTDYSAEALIASLDGYELDHDIGERWDYSNMGYGLLGLALACQARTDYASLARTRIFRPLGMECTTFAPKASDGDRQAQPHSADLKPAPLLNVPGLEAAGAAWSTADDMLTFLTAASPLAQTPLTSAFQAMLASPRVRNPMGADQALGWWVWGEGESQLLSHDGGTIGSSASIFLDANARTGVVVLCNTMAFGQTGLMTNELGRLLLRPG